jgi:hypothetical protein
MAGGRVPTASVWRAAKAALVMLLVACVLGCQAAPGRAASGGVGPAAGAPARASAQPVANEGASLESAAHKAGETGRKVAMSLIALGFAVAAIVLAFRRDFKEAVGVFAIGIVAVLLAQEAGVKLVENLVHSLFGS